MYGSQLPIILRSTGEIQQHHLTQDEEHERGKNEEEQ